MTATLADIDAAIMDRLAELTLPSGTSFKLASRYAGEISRDDLAKEVIAKAPAVLLSCDGERAETDSEELLTGETELVATSAWSCLVVTSDVRSTSLGLKGGVGQAGCYQLASTLRDELHGLEIAGLYRNERLRYAGTAPVLMTRGLYVMAVRFTARVIALAADVADDSVDLERIDTEEHLHNAAGLAAGAPDPMAATQSDTTD